jgi:hypothetical protein
MTNYDPMLTVLTEIRDTTAGHPDPYNSEAVDAAVSRLEAFEEVLLRDYPILGYCGCGSPEKTLADLLKALEYCNLDTELDGERAKFLLEHFNTDYVSDNGLLQFLFYMLITMNLISHNYSLNATTLTPTGEVFYELLKDYMENGTNLT